MTTSDFIKLYLQLNVLLFASYALFYAFRWVASAARVKAGHSQILRSAQLLVLISIALPFALYLMPHPKLPALSFGTFQVGSEKSAAKPGKALNTRTHHEQPVAPELKEATQQSFTLKMIQWIQSYENAGVTYFALLVWALGLLFCLGRLFKSISALKVLVASAASIRKIGKVDVSVSDSVSIPFSVRLKGKSWVVLPISIFANRGDFKLAVRHELQHHRQHDTLWALIIEVLMCAFYPNPAIYLWKKEITELQEFSCDEALIGHKQVSSHDYGSCLVRVAETALGVRKMYAGTTCMAAASQNPAYFKSFLRRRIEMLVGYRKSRTRHWVGAGMGTLVVLLTVAAAYGADQSVRKEAANAVNPGKVEVDEAIQEIADRILIQAVKKQKAASGFAIVADPNSGRILAVANFDAKVQKTGHWVLSHLMEPASLTKTIVAAQAIENGLSSPQESHLCENGSYRYGGSVYHDWKETGWPSLTTEETITNSSDICSIKIGEKLGVDGLVKMLQDYGIGPNGTAKSFPAAKTGVLPPPDDPKYPRLIPYVSSGFGFRITPIEMLQAYGAIANGGELLMPKGAKSADSEKEVVRRVLSQEAAKQTRQILQQVVLKGTAKGFAESTLYTTAGKTATGYSSSRLGTAIKADLAQFIGFAPVVNPRIEVYVAIREPHTDKKGGAHGSRHAAPVFKQIVEEVLKEMKVAPDKPQV